MLARPAARTNVLGSALRVLVQSVCGIEALRLCLGAVQTGETIANCYGPLNAL